jgi:precorrin-6B methylase 1
LLPRQIFFIMKQGYLTVVGTGINAMAHCSIEAKAYIEQADVVYSLVTDIISQDWVSALNPNVRSLQPHYQFGRADGDDLDLRRSREESYEQMIQTLVGAVREGKHVVAIFYGHPGVFAYPSHESIRRLRREGYEAEMLPGISAEDCLFADLGVDPGDSGCAHYEASTFLFYQAPVNTAASLILWQIGVVGDHTLQRLRPAANGLAALAAKLQGLYPADHRIAVYEAASLPTDSARIDWMPLSELPRAEVTLTSTLFVPPATRLALDMAQIERFGLTPEQVRGLDRN